MLLALAQREDLHLATVQSELALAVAEAHYSAISLHASKMDLHFEQVRFGLAPVVADYSPLALRPTRMDGVVDLVTLALVY